MKIIFVAPKANIPLHLIKKVKDVAEVYFFKDNPIDIRKINLLREKGEKILCPFPEPMSWNFPSKFIKDIPDLKAICLPTTSYDWIDGKLARSLNINLTNVPNPPNAVAEGAVFMMMAVARRYAEVSKEDKFEYIPSNFLLELRGKTMGIIGLGKIGGRIAEIGKALGMKVVYWSQNTRDDKYDYLDLDEVFQQSDFVFPSIVLNEETKNFISREKINLMKATSSLISIANAGVIDIDYLTTKVANKELYGCAFEKDSKSPRDFKGNVFTTLPNNWYTQETVSRKVEIWVENIIGAIKDAPINLVN